MEQSDSDLLELVETVETHYANHPHKPLFLSRFGVNFPELRKKLRSKYGSLSNSILMAKSEGLGIQVKKIKVGGDYIDHEKFTSTLSNQEEKNERSFRDLPNSLKIAFCAATEEGQVIIISKTPPHKYQKIDTGAEIPSGFIVIDDNFRLPGIPVQEAESRNLKEMNEKLNAWLTDRGLSITDFIRDEAPSVAGKHYRSQSALDRFLRAQDQRILEKIILPADIADILSRN